MIEGQPQQRRWAGAATVQFSGLVIEGQPQLPTDAAAARTQFSGLVIEGQPQPHTGAVVSEAEFSGLVIEGRAKPLATRLHVLAIPRMHPEDGLFETRPKKALLVRFLIEVAHFALW